MDLDVVGGTLIGVMGSRGKYDWNVLKRKFQAIAAEISIGQTNLSPNDYGFRWFIISFKRTPVHLAALGSSSP